MPEARAITVLRKHFDGRPCTHATRLCQHELRKAIRMIETRQEREGPVWQLVAKWGGREKTRADSLFRQGATNPFPWMYGGAKGVSPSFRAHILVARRIATSEPALLRVK